MYNITSESINSCFSCDLPCPAGVCQSCKRGLPFSAAWWLARREGPIKALLHDYKFARAYSAHKTLSSLLDARLPVLPLDTVIVPIPTIARHIRQRGYDHASLIAKSFAGRRKLLCQPLLKRKTNSVQVGANQAQRKRQASQAFDCRRKLSSNATYLIVDDIVTTGATMRAAADCLRRAGAEQIIVASITR